MNKLAFLTMFFTVNASAQGVVERAAALFESRVEPSAIKEIKNEAYNEKLMQYLEKCFAKETDEQKATCMAKEAQKELEQKARTE